MRIFTTTKVLLILALLAANTGAARRAAACYFTDSNCEKTCGAGSQVTGSARTCSGGTCYVTVCWVTSGLCNQPGTGNYNDCCYSTPSFFCEPY
jgi:hypothetical protein